jgi:hypothetical protein
MSTPGFSAEASVVASGYTYYPVGVRAIPSPSEITSAQAFLPRLRLGQRLGFTCNPVFCACRGDADCNDMFGAGVCGPRDICIDDHCYCQRRFVLA